MNTKDWKNIEINSLLMEKWNYKKKMEEDEELTEWTAEEIENMSLYGDPRGHDVAAGSSPEHYDRHGIRDPGKRAAELGAEPGLVKKARLDPSAGEDEEELEEGCPGKDYEEPIIENEEVIEEQKVRNYVREALQRRLKDIRK